MLSISIGPLAFPVAPLVMLAAIWVGTVVAGRLAAKGRAAQAENAIWLAALIGLIGARIGFVLVHRDAYWQHPSAVFDIRDGGWLAWAGFLAAGLWLAQYVWRRADLLRAVVSAAIVVLTIWLPATVVLWHSQRAGAEQSIPAITVVALRDGTERPLAAVLANTAAVVNIWATWCGPCRIEMPMLARAQQRHTDIQFVFVNQAEDALTIASYLSRADLRLNNVWIDKAGALGPAVGSSGLPTTVFFDANGRRVDAHFGVLSAASLQARIQQLQ